MALIDNINEVKAHNGAVGTTFELANIQSFIDDAIDSHIVKAIGRSFYEGLVSLKSTGTVKEKKVIAFLQKSAVGFTIANYADNGSVQITNSGISVVKSDKSLPASDKKIVQLKNSNLEMAYSALENAVNYIEENINDFQVYKHSDAHQNNRGSLINTSAEFQAAGVQINSSSRLFYGLKPYVQNAIDTYITPIIGDDLLEGIIDKIKSDTLDDDYKKLLKKIRKPLAVFTMVEAIPYKAVSITDSGIFELSNSVGGFAANMETKQPASERRLAAVMNGYNIRGEDELVSLKKFIRENSEKFEISIPEIPKINDGTSNVYFF